VAALLLLPLASLPRLPDLPCVLAVAACAARFVLRILLCDDSILAFSFRLINNFFPKNGKIHRMTHHHYSGKRKDIVDIPATTFYA
jgi:hypothetical protein